MFTIDRACDLADVRNSMTTECRQWFQAVPPTTIIRRCDHRLAQFRPTHSTPEQTPLYKRSSIAQAASGVESWSVRDASVQHAAAAAE